MNIKILRPIFALVLVAFFSVIDGAYAMAPVDINSATVQQLEQIKGIGPTRAHSIVAYRVKHKRFSSVAELVKVKGIGSKTVEKLKGQLVVGKARAAK